MKTIMIAAIIMGVLLIATFGMFVFAKANSPNNTSIEKAAQITSCSSCQGQCTATNNCGSATCAAKTGGKCNCGAK